MENMLNDEVAEETKEYRWETGYEKTWEAINGNNDRLVDDALAEIIKKAKRRLQNEKSQPNRLGMMRHLIILLDCSESMKVNDLKPTRWVYTLKLLENFVDEFFVQNPISQLGIILLRNKRGERATGLTGTSKLQLKAIKDLEKQNLIGEPSIQNGLELAYSMLKAIPAHASREILLILSSLTTCDPGNINAAIDIMKNDNIRCSVITLSAEVHICRELTRRTNGRFGAVLDDSHFRNLLMEHLDPPPTTVTHQNALIKMGFPYDSQSEDDKELPLSMCMCHIENNDEPSKLTTNGYYCPQCYSKYCELPVECLICGLTLVSAPHLARSYHHLFPVQNFKELIFAEQSEICYACKREVIRSSDKNVYQCEHCQKYYCSDCDIFMHDTLHSCIGCNTISNTASLPNIRHSKTLALSSTMGIEIMHSTYPSKSKNHVDGKKINLMMPHIVDCNNVNISPLKISTSNIAAVVLASLNTNGSSNLEK